MAEVEKQAEQYAKMLAALIVMIGSENPQLRADAEVLVKNSGKWATSVRGVAEYEPWVAAMFTGSTMSGRAMAWLQFAIATGTILFPIAMNHNAVPPKIAAMLQQASQFMPDDPFAAQPPQPAQPSAPVESPIAA
jgi:hypothetical protein